MYNVSHFGVAMATLSQVQVTAVVTWILPTTPVRQSFASHNEYMCNISGKVETL